MAIDMKEFTEEIERGLKADKGFTRFLYRFKIDGRQRRGILDYSAKQWDKRSRIAKAKAEFLAQKEKQVNSGVSFTENSSLNEVAAIYFKHACEVSSWTDERRYIYDLYCKDEMGRKRIKNIRQVDFDYLRKRMETKGLSKQSANGCSPRTIRKLLLQILKPIMQYAVDNKVIDDIPNIKAPKQNRKKKIVEHAGAKLAALFQSIMTLYRDDAFYRALFLFALYGRRWNEIRTLQWRDIDFLDNTYTVRAENNKVGRDQTYELSAPIAEALSQIRDAQGGLVFKSPRTGRELFSPKKQLEKVKEAAGIPELTMHYFRHILVSAMGEAGTASTILSASLGHTNLDTVNNFYLSANHTKASKVANEMIGALTSGAVTLRQ